MNLLSHHTAKFRSEPTITLHEIQVLICSFHCTNWQNKSWFKWDLYYIHPSLECLTLKGIIHAMVYNWFHYIGQGYMPTIIMQSCDYHKFSQWFPFLLFLLSCFSYCSLLFFQSSFLFSSFINLLNITILLNQYNIKYSKPVHFLIIADLVAYENLSDILHLRKNAYISYTPPIFN